MVEKNAEEMIGFSQKDIDVVGEIANISFGSASTVLSTLLNRSVHITTPSVEVVDLYDASDVEIPHVVLGVSYDKAIDVENMLVLKTEGAAVIADLMMMGNGEVDPEKELTELELSAVKEAMNQMMGNAATAMSELFNDIVDISPPSIKVVSLKDEIENLTEERQDAVKISFDLHVGDLVHSKIMQIISIKDAKKMVYKLLGANEMNKENTVIVEESEKLPDIREERAITPHLPTTSNKIEENILKGVEIDLLFIFGRKSTNLKEFLSYQEDEIIELFEDINEPVKMMINGVLIGLGELVNVSGYFGVRVIEAVIE